MIDTLCFSGGGVNALSFIGAFKNLINNKKLDIENWIIAEKNKLLKKNAEINKDKLDKFIFFNYFFYYYFNFF